MRYLTYILFLITTVVMAQPNDNWNVTYIDTPTAWNVTHITCEERQDWNVPRIEKMVGFHTYLKTTDAELKPDYGVKYKCNQRDYKTAWQVTGIAVFATITEAVGDGLYDEGKSTGNRDKMMLGKGMQAVSLASHFLYIPALQDNEKWWLAPISELGIRILLFDPTYNVTRGLPIHKIGNTTYWDRALMWTKQPEKALFWGRAVVCTFTVSLTFNQFK